MIAAKPPPDIIERIVAGIARKHPYGGNRLCAAVREAAEAGWVALERERLTAAAMCRSAGTPASPPQTTRRKHNARSG